MPTEAAVAKAPIKTDSANTTSNNMMINSGYWPSWKLYEGVYPSCVDISMITHVNYAFASLDGDGTLYLEDENLYYEMEVDGTNGGLRAWTQIKLRQPNLKIILSVGGGHESATSQFADIATSPAKVNKFAASARALVDKFNLDGIDVDWEHPNTMEQGKEFLKMMIALRKMFPAPYLLTTALPTGQYVLQNIPLALVAEEIDYLNLMAYDFVGPSYANVVLTGHHAQLFKSGGPPDSGASGAAAVDFLISQGVPAQKLVFGIPTYGRSFRGADGPYQSFHGAGANNGEYEVRDLPKPGMKEYYDSDAVAVFATGNGEFVTYDNKHSVAQKAEWAKSKGLGGLFYWHLGADRQGGESLVAAGYRIVAGASAAVGNQTSQV